MRIRNVSFLDVFMVVVSSFLLNMIVLLHLWVPDRFLWAYHILPYILKIVVLLQLRNHCHLFMYSIVSILHMPSGFCSMFYAFPLFSVVISLIHYIHSVFKLWWVWGQLYYWMTAKDVLESPAPVGRCVPWWFHMSLINKTHFFHLASVNIPELACGVPHVSPFCHKSGVLFYFGFDTWSYMW